MRRAGLQVTLALNHSPTAIASHTANHPQTLHRCVDLSQTDPAAYMATGLLWASPACTFFSSAKQPSAPQRARGARTDEAALRSRATGFDMLRWLECWQHPAAVVENVPRWRSWSLFPTVLDGLDRLGYDHRIVYRNAALDGAVSWRDRMFLVAWRRGMPQPELEVTAPATCAAHGTVAGEQRFTSTFEARQTQVAADLDSGRRTQPLFDYGRFGRDWELACPTCGGPAAPQLTATSTILEGDVAAAPAVGRPVALRPATIARLRRGLARHGRPDEDEPVTGERRPLLVLNYAPHGRVWPAATAPLNTITGVDSHGLLTVERLEPGPTSDGDVDRLLSTATYRMLTVTELKRAMGFDDGYTLSGTDRQQRIQVGMAVAPPTAQALATQIRPLLAAA